MIPSTTPDKARIHMDIMETGPKRWFISHLEIRRRNDANHPEAMPRQRFIESLGLPIANMLGGCGAKNDDYTCELGRDLATTEGAVIFENELMQLIRYTPLFPHAHQRPHPLLMVPPCISKFYILDLQPGNSLVRFALEQGHSVYMVSWRNADAGMRHFTWDDYLASGVHKAIDVTLEASESDRLNALGFCTGGTMLACAVAVLSKNDRKRVASLSLLSTLLDFSDAGVLADLVTESSVAACEAAIGNHGVARGAELSLAFSSLSANDQILPHIVGSHPGSKASATFDLQYWNADATNFPGPMLCWYLRNTYLENRLRVPGNRGIAVCRLTSGSSICRSTFMPRTKTTLHRGEASMPAGIC